jgi:cytochrome c-type biogenesis protein CcmH/NrfG
LADLRYLVLIGPTFTRRKGENKSVKYTIAVVLAVIVAVIGYFGIRRLARKDLGFTPAKRYASKLANTLIHTEATAAQEAGASLAS